MSAEISEVAAVGGKFLGAGPVAMIVEIPMSASSHENLSAAMPSERGRVAASFPCRVWAGISRWIGDESGTPSRMGKLWWLRLLVALGLAALLIPIGRLRLIDGDEGYYLQAARLVSEGKRVYTDFFYPQMPFGAHVYAAWFWLWGRGWYCARLLSSLLAVGTGLLLLEILLRTCGRKRWAILGVALYLATGLGVGWFSIAKSFGLTAFLLSLGILLLEVAQTPLLVACGGLAFALAVECRLYVVVAFPCALLFLLRRHGFSRRGLKLAMALAAGALAGGLLLLPYVFRDWHNFYFGNWTYHSIREFGQSGFITNLPNKKETLLSILYLDRERLPGSLQFLGLTAAALWALLSPFSSHNRITSYLWLALFLTSLIPSPTLPQYFCLLIPLLVVEAVVTLASLRAWKAWSLVAALAIPYLILGARDLKRYTTTGEAVPGVWTQDRVVRWTIPTVLTVAQKIDAAGKPVGASWWPGYFVTTRTPLISTLANDFGLRAAPRLPPRERRRFGIVTHDEVAGMMDQHDPPLFVVGNWAAWPAAGYLPKKGYRLVDSFKNASIYVAP
jgi:hypothetical protein